MYDSLNSDNYLKSAKPLLSKIAYQLEIKGRIEVFTVNMQLQDGGIDCGLDVLSNYVKTTIQQQNNSSKVKCVAIFSHALITTK